MLDHPLPIASHLAGERIKIDLHVHTCYSPDSLTSLDDLTAAVETAGLDGLAVLDHNCISGAQALREMAPFLVIVGEEVSTTAGEVAGLFLSECVPPGLSPAEAVERIHEQGGLVYVPHPFDRYRSSALGGHALTSILDQVDAIEVLNARVLFPTDNDRALAFARDLGIPGGAGSDAHSTQEIGRAFVEMERFEDAAGFLRGLEQACIRGHESSPHVHLLSTWAKFRRRIGS